MDPKDAKMSEQGYALVTVLLIVTIFSVLFLAFMGQSFNSVKQNQVVEKRSQSVALAEMGGSYYDVAIQKIFEDIKAVVEEKVENKTFLTEEQVIEYMRTELKSRIKNIPPTTDSIDDEATFTLDKSTSDQNSTYEITDKIKVTRSGDKLKINITIIGTKKDNNTNLDVEMVIDNLSTIKINTTAAKISFGQVKEPDINNVNCNNPTSFNDLNVQIGNNGNGNSGNSNLNYTCPDVYINQPSGGTKTYDENNNVNVSSIYSTVDLAFKGNLNNTGSIDIYAKSLNIEKNFNNPTNVTVETEGIFSIGSNINGKNVNNIKFYVGGLFISSGQLNLQKDSRILIRGNRTQSEINAKTVSSFSKELDIDSSSVVCINGDVKVSSIKNDGQFIIRGTIFKTDGITPYPTSSMTKQPIYIDNTNQNSYQEQCLNTFETPTSSTVEWGTLTNSILNGVTYP